MLIDNISVLRGVRYVVRRDKLVDLVREDTGEPVTRLAGIYGATDARDGLPVREEHPRGLVLTRKVAEALWIRPAG